MMDTCNSCDDAILEWFNGRKEGLRHYLFRIWACKGKHIGVEEERNRRYRWKSCL